MVEGKGKSLLIVVRHSPYGSNLARNALDTALAAAAFEQRVALLFTGDGVLQLVPHQDGNQLGVRDMAKQLASLPLYDIDSVYVDAAAAARYQLDLDHSPVPAKALNPAAVNALLQQFDHLLGF